jgi:hypothetical protein
MSIQLAPEPTKPKKALSPTSPLRQSGSTPGPKVSKFDIHIYIEFSSKILSRIDKNVSGGPRVFQLFFHIKLLIGSSSSVRKFFFFFFPPYLPKIDCYRFREFRRIFFSLSSRSKTICDLRVGHSDYWQWGPGARSHQRNYFQG